MTECSVCRTDTTYPYECSRCGEYHCSSHQLPENHDCRGLENQSQDSVVVDDNNHTPATIASIKQTVLGAKRTVWTYCDGNMTHVLIGAFWVLFFVQLGIGAVFGRQVMSDVFVLSSAHPEHIWTVFTSLFAHGGFTHILMNSLSLLFIGQLVERQLGTKRFLRLFFAGGMAAGIGQLLFVIAVFPASLPVSVVGASGGITAILGVLTLTAPQLRVYGLDFLPLWVFTALFVVYSLLGASGILGGGVAHVSHLTGLFVGLVFAKMAEGIQMGRLRI